MQQFESFNRQAKEKDPLTNWFKQKPDITSRMMARIQNLAGFICANVKWSFLIEPGHAKTDLSVSEQTGNLFLKLFSEFFR